MEPDLDDIIVTTGGQQAIDLVAKTLVDPGDVVIAEAPTYPGAVPVFCSYEAETIQVERGRRRDAHRRARGSCSTGSPAEGRRPKFIYTVPSFQNPAGVTMSAERRRRLVEIARERELLVVEDNPYGLLRYEGEPAEPLYKLDGGDYVLYLGHLLEDPLARDPARLALRAAAGDGEGGARQAGVRPLHLDPDPVLRSRVLRRGQLARATSASSAAIYRERRDAMLEALERYFPPGATWSHPEGGLFCWATLPDYIDTTDLLAKALRENVAFVPGAAAFVDGRGGSSMRLNFSASGADEIREGIKRIGRRDRRAGGALRSDHRRAPILAADHRHPRRRAAAGPARSCRFDGRR